MERNRPKCVTARGPLARSDSRKRNRRSESPENVSIKTKDKHTPKRHRKVTVIDDQPKITSYSADRQNESTADEDITHQPENSTLAASAEATQVNMAEVSNVQIMEELRKMNDNLNDKMDKCMKKMDDRMDLLEGKFTGLEIKQERAEDDIKSISQNLELNNENIVELQHSTKLAYAHAERNEQYERNYNQRIINLPEKKNETIQECESLVLKLFSEQLGIDVPIEAIDNLHRLGPLKEKKNGDKPQNDKGDKTQAETNETSEEIQNQNVQEASADRSENNENGGENMDIDQTKQNELTDQTQSRPVIVSFVARRVWREVLTNRYKLKKKTNQTSAPIIIVEDLTKQRHALFAKAREAKEKFKKVWTREGRIFARQHNGVDVPVDTFSDITSPPVDARPARRSYYTPYFSPRGRGGYGRGRGTQRFYGPGGYVYNGPWGQGQARGPPSSFAY